MSGEPRLFLSVYRLLVGVRTLVSVALQGLQLAGTPNDRAEAVMVSMNPLHDALEYIDSEPTERQPTEVLVPLVMKTFPSWDYQNVKAGFGGGLEVFGFEGEPFWECEHTHDTRDEAAECVGAEVRRIAAAWRTS